MHQTVGNTLRALVALHPPAGIDTANQLVDTALSNCLFATRATINGTLEASPGSLAFSRDMILDISLMADWKLLQQRRQQLIDNRLMAADCHRFSHDYHTGDNILKLEYKPDKLERRAHGPYRIEAVHTNGTVTIRLTPHVIERISIRCIKPYRV